MRSLNSKRMKFVSDTIHRLKTSSQPVYRFLSGGTTGKVTCSKHYVKQPNDTSKVDQALISTSTDTISTSTGL